ncbi:hypothetical protein JCM6882_001395 [Rhodosporidiobolus microsporus]
MAYPPQRPLSPSPSSLRARSPSSSSFNPTALTVHIPQPRPLPSAPDAPPPRWRTREFALYYGVFALAVPWMGWVGARVSRATNPLYWEYQHKLSDGWLFGWRIDVSDPQYHLFRSNLPLLVLLASLHLSLSHLFRLFFRPSRAARARFSAAFSCALVAVLHGTSALKIALIMWGNWVIVRKGSEAGGSRARRGWWRREWTPFAIWGFNIGVLFVNELSHGWRFGALYTVLEVLDSHPGLLPRWHISWNISMLRLVSWGMEHYWATAPGSSNLTSSAGANGREPLLPEPPTSPMQKAARTSPSPPSSAPSLSPDPSSPDWSPALYVAYVLYPPLYMAGPIMSYPSFAGQLSPLSSSSSSSQPSPPPAATPSTSLSADDPPPASPPYNECAPRALLSYTLRFLFCLLTMEVLLHAMYPVAIKDVRRPDASGWWEGFSAAEVAMVGFWNLVVVWLKLLLPWRLFRLWSLLDGVAPPENMVRCMANNYSTLGFWRSWHRSYNLWVVRYLYIPLGGSSRPALATLGVFTFVALWHDLRLRLLVWGWAVTGLVVPEIAARKLFAAAPISKTPLGRPLAAVGGVLNILLLMTANLVGFVVGVDGAGAVWGKVVGGWEGRLFLLLACLGLFVAVQVMFEYREEERRRGINRKC